MPQVQISPATGKIRDPECSQINTFLKTSPSFPCSAQRMPGRAGTGQEGWGGVSRQARIPVLRLRCCVAAGKSLSFSSASRTKAPEGTSRERSQGHRGTRRARSPRCRWGRSRDRSEGATIPPGVGGTGSAHCGLPASLQPPPTPGHLSCQDPTPSSCCPPRCTAQSPPPSHVPSAPHVPSALAPASSLPIRVDAALALPHPCPSSVGTLCLLPRRLQPLPPSRRPGSGTFSKPPQGG